MSNHASLVRRCLVAFAFAGCSIEDVEDDELELDDDDVVERGLKLGNGLKLANGLSFANGLKLANGVSLSSGLAVGTGLSTSAGLSTAAGLSTSTGFMTTEAGQTLVKYLVECALPAGQSISKSDPVHGGTRVFNGLAGLGAGWKLGACDANCQTAVSACLMARTNELGQQVQIDLRSTNALLGTASSGVEFSIQEGAFFGNLFANPPKAYTCKGVDGSFGLFEGRTCANGGACGFVGLAGYCRDTCVKQSGVYKDCKIGGVSQPNIITTYLDPTPFAVGCPAGCDACYNGTCTFICTPGATCASQVLDCPVGWACEAVCDGTGVCGNTDLDCVGTNECSLTCMNGSACSSTEVFCGEGDCDVYCEGTACSGATLRVQGGGDGVMKCSVANTGEMCVDTGAGTCTKVGC